MELGLSLSEATSAIGAINSCPPSATLCIASHRVVLIIFLTPQLCIQNGSREQNHAPFRGDLSSLWQDLIYSPYVQSLRVLALAIPEIRMGPPKFETCHMT